ncbi:hypothetical protein ABIF41_006048 [Bradyrhizobium japonicum]
MSNCIDQKQQHHSGDSDNDWRIVTLFVICLLAFAVCLKLGEKLYSSNANLRIAECSAIYWKGPRRRPPRKLLRAGMLHAAERPLGASSPSIFSGHSVAAARKNASIRSSLEP